MHLKKSYLLFLIFTIAAMLSGCGTNQSEPVFSGPNLGQSPPGDAAEIFAPGIVSTGMNNRDITISPDGSEIYFGMVVGQSRLSAIATSKLENGRWTTPEIAEFSRNSQWFTLEPHITPDGKRLLFMSDRPDSAAGESEPGDEDIWCMDRTENGWGAPYNLGEPVNSDDEEYFPSVTLDGTIYFTRQDSGSPIGHIYRSKLVNGTYTEAERLPDQVNSGQTQYNAFISPDESYIIVPTYGREDSFGATDYYISFRNENDEWTEAINMGGKINSANWQEYSPYVSPNGKYLFFMSGRTLEHEPEEALTLENMKKMHNSPYNGSSNIFWIDASIIKKLENQAYSSE